MSPMRFSVALTVLASCFAFAPREVAAQAVDPQVLRQVEDRIRDYVRQRQEYEQQIVRAVQQRNEQLARQYQEQARKQADAYRNQLKELQEAGVTPNDLRKMQRDALLAQLPRSQRSALERKWAREDRIRQRLVARAKVQGEPVPADAGEVDLGGLDGLKLD